ncbi:MAG: flagellar motor switch protein FliG [Acidimicrobiales bacterium]
MALPVALLGPQKAALVIAQLDEEHAQRVLKGLSETEVIDLIAEMASLPALEPHVVRTVLGEFLEQAAVLFQVKQGGIDVARKLLEDRLGRARAEEIISELEMGDQVHPLAFLNKIDPLQVASFLADEHPQTIAVVLAHLSSDDAARVLAEMHEQLRVDVARRIATIGRIPPEAVSQVAEVLERKLANLIRSGVVITEIGGISSIVSILNHSERSTEKQILSELEETDPELAEQIRNELFVFDDITNLDDRTLQRVLRNVVAKDLAVALKGVSDQVRDKFLLNMSERAQEDLTEEMEILGPIRVSQVESAQQAVVRVVRELESAGEIVLVRGDEQLVQ